MNDEPQTVVDLGKRFLINLGLCITEWARVEDQLFKVCRDILGTPSVHTAIIYYRTPTLETRLVLADELMDTIFPPPESGKHRDPDYDMWDDICSKIRDHAPTRNRLAHSPVGPAIYVKDGVRGLRFQSYQHPNEKARGKADKDPLTIEHLEAHRESVLQIHEALKRFRGAFLPAHIAKLFPQNISILTGQD